MYYNGKKVMATVIERFPSFVYLACINKVYWVNGDDHNWGDVRVLFASNTEYSITDNAGLAKALHENGYTSERKFANVVKSVKTGLVGAELKGAFSLNGVDVFYITTTGTMYQCIPDRVTELKKYTRI